MCPHYLIQHKIHSNLMQTGKEMKLKFGVCSQAQKLMCSEAQLGVCLEVQLGVCLETQK